MAAKRARTDGEGGGGGSGEEGKKWLVCVDGSAGAAQALDWALAHARPGDALTVLSVVELVEARVAHPTKFLEKFQDQLNEEQVERAKSMLAEIKKAHETELTTHVMLAKRAAEAICEYASDANVDTLVLARRSLPEAERHIMGSCSEYCVRHAHCDVVLIRPM